MESDPTGLLGGLNTYGYVNVDPIGWSDPLGLREVIVSIWKSHLYNGEVGHVSVNDPDGTVITSQFPNRHHYIGKNVTKDWAQTVDAEGKQPDSIYEINLPNDMAITEEANKIHNITTWYYLPNGKTTTSCSDAAYHVLKSGGLKLPHEDSLWPDWMSSDLFIESLFDNNIKRLNKVPW